MYFFSAARPQIQADPGVFLCTAQADPGRDERTPSAHVSCGYLQRLKSREVLEHVLRQGRELAGRDVTFFVLKRLSNERNGQRRKYQTLAKQESLLAAGHCDPQAVSGALLLATINYDFFVAA